MAVFLCFILLSCFCSLFYSFNVYNQGISGFKTAGGAIGELRLSKGSKTALGMFRKKQLRSEKQSGILITDDQYADAYKAWMDANDFLPTTAPAYLTEVECRAKFSVIANAIKDANAAVSMVRNDPVVFSFGDAKLQDSFASWATRLESEAEARALLVRSPALMSLANKQVLEAKQDSIYQSYFWSYFGAVTRLPTKALLAVLKPIKRAMMAK